MKVLYISNYVDKKYFKSIFNNAKEKPIQSIQKFGEMFTNGLIKQSEVDEVDVISAAPVNRRISKKLLWKGKKYSKNGITFEYIPFINIRMIKQICLFFSSFFILLLWCIKNYRKEKVLIFDGFYPIISSVAVFICFLFNIMIVGLYTDIPKCMNHNIKKQNLFNKITKFVVNVGDYLNRGLSSAYIFLTKEMNEIVNKKNRPYIVMEGMVDISYLTNRKYSKSNAIMYAGGLYETYGIKMLIDSFIKWNNKDYELWLCGDGDLVDYIKKLNNKRIKYFGSLPNDKVVEMEKRAKLLVNPRFTNDEYTKYSFPSKTMEYMLSGTPVLTTKLAGIPNEYDNYLYYIGEETIDGLVNCFNEILVKTSYKKLSEKGKESCLFVKNNKNNYKQAERVTELIKNNIKRNNICYKIVCIYLLFNISLLVLSALNVYGLFPVSFKTYFLYILGMIFTLVGIKVIKPCKPRVQPSDDYKILKSKFFTVAMIILLMIVGWYFIKYLVVISGLSQSEIRMAAYKDLYDNAYDALFRIYIVGGLVTVVMILISLYLFDNTYKYSKIYLSLFIPIFLLNNLIGFGRIGYLYLIISSLFTMAFFGNNKKEKNNKKKIYIIVCLIGIFVISCIMMYFRAFNSNTSSGILDVIKYQFDQVFEYFLGSFRMLDNLIQRGFTEISSMMYGRATFAGIEEIILYPIKFFGSDILSSNQILGEITQKSIAIGANTPYFNAFYTNIMNFYLDFGIIGVMVFSMLHGMFVKFVINTYYKDNSLVSKILLIFVAQSMIMNSFQWQYQSGSRTMLVVLLLAINYFYRRYKRDKSIMDS